MISEAVDALDDWSQEPVPEVHDTGAPDAMDGSMFATPSAEEAPAEPAHESFFASVVEDEAAADVDSPIFEPVDMLEMVDVEAPAPLDEAPEQTMSFSNPVEEASAPEVDEFAVRRAWTTFPSSSTWSNPTGSVLPSAMTMVGRMHTKGPTQIFDRSRQLLPPPTAMSTRR